MNLRERIQKDIELIWPQLKAIRRHMHMNPELSFEEHETMAYLSNFLTEQGIEHRTGVAGTGIVVDIEGSAPGKVIALRADIDALPIQEANEVPYRSSRDGLMHACGHDVHSASLMGAVMLLHRHRAHFQGVVRCIFQPGEEKIPGGASMMIAEGVLNDPPVELIIGQHVYPQLPAGEVGFRPGMYMASADEVYITVHGKGGHGAMPELNVDPVVIMAEMISSLQQLVSRHAPATVPSVLSFGKILADGATNVIPDEVKMEGTFRTMDEAWRAKAHELIHQICEHVAQAHGGRVSVEVRKGYPYLQNDEQLTGSCMRSATDFLGAGQVHDLPIRMTAEDFAYYSQQVPACFYRLGTASPDGERFTASVHNPHFDIDEEALKTGAGLMAYLALEALK